MSNKDLEDDEILEGERIPSVSKQQSIRSKTNNILSIGLILLFGFGFMYLYYSNMANKESRASAAKKKLEEQQLKSEGNLPKLGKVFSPFATKPEPADTEPVSLGDVFGPPPQQLGQDQNLAMNNNQPPKPKEKTPDELAAERRLKGPVYFSKEGKNPSNPPQGSNSAGIGAIQANALYGQPPFQMNQVSADPAAGSELGDRLVPTAMPSVTAQVLPDLTFLIPKGAKGDCTLETAINSDLPGLVTCVLAGDIFGADHKVKLLDRGSIITGETASERTQMGQVRLFVLWNRVRTPTGVVAELNSPATDSLGRAGITGDINTHFKERFGAAILVSLIDGAIQFGVNYARNLGTGSGSTNINYSQQGTREVATEALKNTVNIPPTIEIPQGERVQILFARDVSFKPVYELTNQYQAYLGDGR